ncbi:MAG: Holliday junction resolvase RuvX [Dehalococcoidales bacterium]
MGLDVGDKRIGVALGDPQGILASPLTIIDRTGDREDIEAITDIIDRNQVGRIIVGLPVSMNGSLGMQARKVEDFTRALRKRVEVPVEFRDERLSTVSAKRLMHTVRKTRKTGKTRHDSMAAALILQSYLDEFSA